MGVWLWVAGGPLRCGHEEGWHSYKPEQNSAGFTSNGNQTSRRVIQCRETSHPWKSMYGHSFWATWVWAHRKSHDAPVRSSVAPSQYSSNQQGHPMSTADNRPLLSPEKAGQKSGCSAYTDDHLLLQGKALFFPLPMKQGMLGKSHLPLPLPPSLVLYWFLENSLKRKPGVLRCSLPSPKLIVSLGREGHRNAGPKPPLYVRTVLEAFQGSPVCQLLSPVLVCALTCEVFLTLPPYNPCMNDSDFPCCLPWLLILELSWVILYFCDYDFLFPLLTFLTRSLNHCHSPLSAVLLWDVRTALGKGFYVLFLA